MIEKLSTFNHLNFKKNLKRNNFSKIKQKKKENLKTHNLIVLELFRRTNYHSMRCLNLDRSNCVFANVYIEFQFKRASI